jgi:hypothetical protein
VVEKYKIMAAYLIVFNQIKADGLLYFKDKYNRYIYIDYCTDTLQELVDKKNSVMIGNCTMKIRIGSQVLLETPSCDLCFKIYFEIKANVSSENPYPYHISDGDLVELIMSKEMTDTVLEAFNYYNI